MRRICYFACILTCAGVIAAEASPRESSPLVPVRVGFMAALSPKDTDYSERFKSGYQAALFYGVGDLRRQMERCGYRYEVDLAFYSGGDGLGPMDAIASLEQGLPWVIFGPDRSNEFLLGAKSRSKGTPIVSGMASAQDVFAQKPPIFSMAPPPDVLALEAVRAVSKSQFGTRFGTVVDSSCLFCKDFATAFKSEGKVAGLVESFSIEVTGESPDTGPIRAALKRQGADFLLIPNYSKQTGHILATLASEFPTIPAVGGDGWGDPEYGFLTKFPLSPQQKGISVRPGKSYEQMQRIFGTQSLVLTWKGEPLKTSYTSFAVMEFLRRVTSLLCERKPRGRSDFVSLMARQPSDYFRSLSGVSILKLHEGQLKYAE